MKETHFFAGNNSSKGFVSFFGSLIDPEQADRIYILKGGPGVGKSSFMKKFGAVMQSKGFDTEYIHCSGDPDSLDGVVIPQLKITLVDGTAPHTIDPKLPGAADEIINLGMFLNSSELVKYKQEILRINKEKESFYKSAYRYLSLAGIILQEINEIYNKITDDSKAALLTEEIVSTVFIKNSASGTKKKGKLRKLFTEAYTSDGYISYTDSYCENKKVLGIIGENIDSISGLLVRLAAEAENRGFEAECCYMPLLPERIQHLIIPELELAFKSADSASSRDFDEIIDLHQILDMEKLQTYSHEIGDNLKVYDHMIKIALEKLAKTKQQHQFLEIYYIKSMDFKRVDSIFNDVISRTFKT